jgi:hypothetical protein
MKRIRRLDAPAAVDRYLAKKSAEVSGGKEVDAVWKAARGTKTMKDAMQALRRATGTRERCCYCMDSLATEIDHFWPKSGYAPGVFLWCNFLPTCASCNRAKGDESPISPSGNWRLINPFDCDPWCHLVYDDQTGNITATWNGPTEDSRGKGTVDVIKPLNWEALSEGRRNAARRLHDAVDLFLSSPQSAGDVAALEGRCRDIDDFGLLQWFTGRGATARWNQLRGAVPKASWDALGR